MKIEELREIPGLGVPGPVVVAVLDGVGLGRGDGGDAVAQASTPNLDRLAARTLLTTRLAAHGRAVGMPSDSDMGNSEVGHNALGAGRIFDQGAKLVSEAIGSGRMFEGSLWKEMVARCVSTRKPLHLIGLLSDGNVHSHIDHLIAMVVRADAEGVGELFVHVLLDGRDVPKTSAEIYIDQLEIVLRPIDAKPDRCYRIASGGGRMGTTMDRYEADWSIVEKGWRTHVLGLGRPFRSACEAIDAFRAEEPGIVDQDLPAFVITENDRPVGTIDDGASVIAFNFRGDRMLELVRAFEETDFSEFDCVRVPDVLFGGMMQYDGDTDRPRRFLVAPPEIERTLGELLCERGIGQVACSETQKFGHVTYFWNGNRSGAFDAQLEQYIEIPSYDPPFDARPEMRAPEIAEMVLREVAAGDHRFLRLNFANGDMVGHTGDFAATVKAVEAVDLALGALVPPILAARGALIVTADHGNADDMVEIDKKTGQLLFDEEGRLVAKTSHSLNPVPFHVVLNPQDAPFFELTSVESPGLGNVAATAALLLGFDPPKGYLPSLLRRRGGA
ncbi:MAG: phosphoglycerate mutase (2,3-diphosphoglycerate-independent) [Gemmatimonadetes bacterium]|nr:phosphoglycerate mutase (2,3-diphosphoglycerate-independent) [Gemmatimonadota bacterium]